MNKVYFKEGDIVLFNWKPSCAKWKRGKVLGNNFPMCNLPDFVGEAMYYIGEIDENGKVICGQKSYAIPADSKYLYLYKDEYAWCIGKSAREVEKPYEKDPLLDDEKHCLEPYDIIMVNHNGTWELDMFQNYINKERTQIHTFKGHLILFDDNWEVYDDEKFKQLFNLDSDYVSKGNMMKVIGDEPVYIPYTSCPELSEDDYAQGDAVKVSDGKNPDYYYWTTSASTKECDKPDERTNSDKIIDLLDYNVELLLELTKLIEKLDDKFNNMNPIIRLEPSPWTPGSPSSPWYDKTWFDKNKVYCTHEGDHTYTAHIKPEDIDKYKEMFTTSFSDKAFNEKFNYKKYNDMSTCNDKKDSTCYEPKKATSLIDDKYDDKYDTWGLSCAAGKITEDKKED